MQENIYLHTCSNFERTISTKRMRMFINLRNRTNRFHSKTRIEKTSCTSQLQLIDATDVRV